MFFFQDTDGLSTTQDIYLSYVDDYWTPNPTWGVYCQFPAIYSKNALSANPNDGYLYFIANAKLIRLDASCDTTQICPIASSVFGTFDNLGRIWILVGTQLSAHDPATCNTVKGPYTIGFSTAGMVDIAYNFEDCHLYLGSQTSVVKVDTNGQSVGTYSPGFNIAGTYGGVAIGADGNFYGMTNVIASSELVRFNLDSLTSDSTVAMAVPGVNASSHGADMASFPCDSVRAQIGVTMVCDSFTALFSDQSVGLISDWYWDFGDGSFSTQKSPQHTYVSPGTYEVTLIVTPLGSACFTVAPDTATLIVEFESISLPDTTICLGEHVAMDITDSSAVSYLWSPASSVSDTDSAVTVLMPFETTTYTAITTMPTACRYALKQVIVQLPNPPAVSNDTTICPDGRAELWVDALQASWSPGTSLSDSTISDPVAMPAITTTYVVTSWDDTVCGPYSSAVTVAVFPPPIVDAGEDTTIEKGTTVQLTGTGNGVTYTWSPILNLTCYDCLSPNASPEETTTYYLTTVDANGCTTVDSVTVTVVVIELHFVMPNAFSPNGDGANDLIAPIVRGRFVQMDFRIYNRWGELLFHTTDDQTGWDGTFNGHAQPVGVYTYVVSGIDVEDGHQAVQSGSINLLR
jgi:gliding motility-associated-like protein